MMRVGELVERLLNKLRNVPNSQDVMRSIVNLKNELGL